MRWALAIGAVFVLVVCVLAVPGARRTTARWFGAGGVEVRIVPTTSAPAAPVPTRGAAPPTTPPPVEAPPGLGDPVTPAEATQRTGLAVPTLAALPAADAVFVDERVPGGSVLAFWASSGGVLVQVVRGAVDAPAYVKIAHAGTIVTNTSVHGGPALFLSGDDHVIAFVDAAGELRLDSARLAGNTLLWDSAGLTYRLESTLDLAGAVTLAESLGD